MRRLIEGRKIPFYKIGGGIRFDQNEIKEFLNNNRVDPI
jgi:excisionase family DNA binding protein